MLPCDTPKCVYFWGVYPFWPGELGLDALSQDYVHVYNSIPAPKYLHLCLNLYLCIHLYLNLQRLHSCWSSELGLNALSENYPQVYSSIPGSPKYLYLILFYLYLCIHLYFNLRNTEDASLLVK